MQLRKPSLRLIPAILVVGLGIPLAGCADGKFVTLSAAGQDFPQAEYQVLGKTRYDQTWIDKTTEAEIAGFGFQRPAKRPASLDASAVVVVTPATVEKPSIISAIKKKFKRKPKPKATPAVAMPEPEVKPTPAPVPLPPAKPEKKKLLQRLKEKLKGTPQ